MREALAPTAPAAQSLRALLEDLRQELLQRIQSCNQAVARLHLTPAAQAGLATQHLRPVQLGVELLCKLEEQLLHPALRDSRGYTWPALAQSMHDVTSLRALSARLADAAPLERPVVAVLLEGLVRLHVEALDRLLREADGSGLPSASLECEMRGLLKRWQAEVRRHGDIEDEDGDPVGQPPR